jgi:hypothetical protein
MRMTGQSADEAARAVLAEIGTIGGVGGVIVVTPTGETAMPFTTPGMFRARADSTGREEVDFQLNLSACACPAHPGFEPGAQLGVGFQKGALVAPPTGPADLATDRLGHFGKRLRVIVAQICSSTLSSYSP